MPSITLIFTTKELQMIRIKDITDHLDNLAPVAYAESYDNVGLLVGEKENEVTSVLVSLDCTEEVVKEAIKLGSNLIVSHHPIIFKGLKSLTGKNYVERTVMLAIRNDIALYAIHTNLDNISHGVNKRISDIIGLKETTILQPKSGALQKITFFVPVVQAHAVTEALFAAGGGSQGLYSECSFRLNGKGTFKPLEGSVPFLGEIGNREEVDETRVELMYPTYLNSRIRKALKAAHPYEEVAFYQEDLANENQYLGSGMIGELPEPTDVLDFLTKVKSKMQVKVIRHTRISNKLVKKVAVCGGSGSFLLGAAKRAGADVFITADFKYHEFFDAEDSIVIADIGHYESEQFTIDLLAEAIREKFRTFATHLTTVHTNPIHYL